MANYYTSAITFNNLYKALNPCLAGIRWKDSVKSYEIHALDNTYSLHQELISNQYKISAYSIFRIYEPKERIIIATRLRDRQFQKSLCDAGLYDDIVEHFIYANGACQVGKGTHFCLNLLKDQIHKMSLNHGTNFYYIKADVSKFFDNIDHKILKQIIQKYISDPKAYKAVSKIIDSYGKVDENNHIVKTHKGIGLGSTISQLLALCYLNPLDHYIKEVLHIKQYVRYMDDFIILHEDKNYLKECLTKIKQFLKNKLKLELNRKTTLQPITQGVKFLQWKFVVKPNNKIYIIADKSKLYKCIYKLNAIAHDANRTVEQRLEDCHIFMQSVIANLSHGDCYTEICAIQEHYSKVIKEIA